MTVANLVGLTPVPRPARDSYSNPLLVLIWFLAFLLVCIAYTFIITAFFDQARTGGVVGMLGYVHRPPHVTSPR